MKVAIKKNTPLIKLLKELTTNEMMKLAMSVRLTLKTLDNYKTGKTEPDYSLALSIISKAEKLLSSRTQSVV